MNSKFLSSLFLLSLIAFAVKCDIITPYGGTQINPLCPASGSINYQVTDLTSSPATTLVYDFATTYLTTESDSAPLLVQKSTGSVGFKFHSPTDDTFTAFNTATCTGTETATKMVALLSKILVVLDGTTYKICKFDNYLPTTDMAAVALSLPTTGLTGAIKTFVPYFFKRSNFYLYVLMNDGVDSAIYTYDTSGSSGPLAANLVGSKFTGKVMTSIHGNNELIYSSVDNSILNIVTGATDPATIPANSLVRSYRLRADVVVLSTLSADGLSGYIYKLGTGAAVQITYSDTTTTTFAEFSDDMSNYVRVGSTSMIWFHQRQVAANFLTSVIPIAEINAGASGEVQSVGLSGDKALIVYSNKVIHLKHVGNGSVKKIYETTTSGMTLTGSNDSQYKIVLSCMCAAVKNFYCFSSTFNCIVLKKAGSVCTTRDPFKPAA